METSSFTKSHSKIGFPYRLLLTNSCIFFSMQPDWRTLTVLSFLWDSKEFWHYDFRLHFLPRRSKKTVFIKTDGRYIGHVLKQNVWIKWFHLVVPQYPVMWCLAEPEGISVRRTVLNETFHSVIVSFDLLSSIC